MKNFLMPLSLLFLLSGCGSEESKRQIDLKEYLPQQSLTKEYTEIKKLNGDLTHVAYQESILVEPNMITTKQDGHTKEVITFGEDTIDFLLVKENNQTKSFKRKVSFGEEIINHTTLAETKKLMIGSQEIGEKSITVKEHCKLESVVKKYEIYFYEYTNYDNNHDIIKIKCSSRKITTTLVESQYINDVSHKNGTVESKENLSYFYLQKSLGVIANIDDDCVVSKSPNRVDDEAKKEECIGEQYRYNLYQPRN